MPPEKSIDQPRLFIMQNFSLAILIACSLFSVCMTVSLWKKDFFFAAFFSMMLIYSVISQTGYLFFPELSIVMLNMYFGPEILPFAIIFSTLSLLALYVGFFKIYRPLTTGSFIAVRRVGQSFGIYSALTGIQLVLLSVGYGYFKTDLNYTNAADVDFIESSGLIYKLFWNLFKFTTFSLIVLYGVVRSKISKGSQRRTTYLLLLIATAAIFALIAVDAGNRTDPLAVMIGIMAFEYLSLQRSSARGQLNLQLHRDAKIDRIPIRPHRRGWALKNWKAVLIGLFFLIATIVALTLVENSRSETVSDDSLETSALTQAILLKDYYTPFHVLIGTMANDFVSPLTVLTSNSANMLMFLKVEYLQFFAVELWSPDTVTRAASPAFFAFTEGYMFAGWFGFVYNGIVWALGIALWRTLSRTADNGFNCIAFAVTVSMIAVVARSQSSYFIKTPYLSFLPALGLYAIASGVRPKYFSALIRWLDSLAKKSGRNAAATSLNS